MNIVEKPPEIFAFPKMPMVGHSLHFLIFKKAVFRKDYSEYICTKTTFFYSRPRKIKKTLKVL